ncbi:MAG: ABC transporter permease, partial [Gammaproteobacteria bacterium]|nr:ABC transporter permease [Gammaproteobacteria bacterium]
FAVFMARNREFIRDTSSWAWNLLFPVMLVIALTFAFGNDNKSLYKVAVYPAVPENAELAFFSTRYIQFLDAADRAQAAVKVERHQLDMLLDVSERNYLVNDRSSNGYILERVLLGSGGQGFVKQTVSGREIRYVDWVMPGVLAMNMMFACLFGVGYVIVRYRKNGVLKRLKATPLKAFEFLSAQVVSRLWLIMAITIVVFLGTHVFLRFTMHGSYFSLLLLFTLGAASLISLGLIVAARTASEELAGGLLNMLSWPMMLLSGVWFSMEGAHPWLQKISLLLPLTHIVDGARAIMIDGAGLLDIRLNLVYLVAVTALFMVVGSRLFRWEQS